MSQMGLRKFRKRSLALTTLSVMTMLSLTGCGGSPEHRAQSYYERGSQFLAQKDFTRASLEFRNALKINKELVDAWRGLIKVEEHNRNWAAVVRMLRTVVELDPKDVSSRMQLARLDLLSNNLDEALKMVDAAIELQNQNAGNIAFKGAILLKLNDTAGAISQAETALAIDPVNPEAILVLASERLINNDAAGALKVLNRAPDLREFGVEVFRLQVHEQLGNMKEVEAILHRLNERYPQDPVFRQQLVRLYVAQRRLEDAEQLLRSSAASNSSDSAAGLDLVRFLLAIKGPDEARKELQARINAGGDNTFPYRMALADLEFSQGDSPASDATLQKLINDPASTRDQVLNAKIRLAQTQLSRKNADAAEYLVSTILEKDQRNVEALKLRASINLERGRLEPAIADLRQALNEQPRSVDMMLLLALAYERSGSIELAEKQFADSTRTSNFAPDVGLNYAAFLQRRGSPDRGDEILNELASRWPNNVAILSALAEARLRTQNWVGAEELAERIRRIENGQTRADQILSASLVGRNKFSESLDLLQRIHAASPAAAQPIAALVSTYMRAQQQERAIDFLSGILAKNQSNAEAHALLGSVYLSRNEPDKAESSFKAAIEAQKTNVVGYRALADFYLRQHKIDDAERTIRNGLEAQPDSFALRLALANMKEQEGDFEAAIAEYERMLNQQSASLIAMNNLASLLLEHRTDKSSLGRAQTLAASLRKSQVPQFKDTLGWALYHNGDYKGAVLLLEEAADQLPNNALVRYHLGMSYLAIDKQANAAEQLKKSLELAANEPRLAEKVRAALKKLGV